MRLQHTLLAALALAAGIASADPILPGADATATTAAIQAAIDAAVPSQGTVTLGAGLFEIDSQLMVTGGVTLAGQGWDSTIIKQVAETPSENTRVVTVSGGATVERVTLTGGRLAGPNDKSGGGAYVSGGTVSWCCITNNSVSEANIKFGGGIGFSQGSGGTVDHCIIADNSVSTSTSDEIGGGGIGAYRPLGPITIDSCLISGNRAIRTTGYGRGGGIGIEFIYQQNPVVVRNTTIVGNAAGEGETASKGGAVFTNNDSGKKLTMIDCIVAGNTTAGAATTMSLNYDGGVDYCFFDIEADKVGANSLFGDPQFVDSADGNYRLSSTSPAREAGATYSGIGVDLDGVDFGSPPSMGCYEAGGVAKVKAPVFFPASGTRFYPTTNATLSCETADAAIYYTLDGSDPTDSSTPYTAPIEISATTTIKARAYKQDLDPSAIVVATYTYVEQTPGIHPGATPAETRQTIQDAIDAAAPTSGTVVLAKGLFEIDEQLMITNGVTLVGQGWTNTVIRQTTTGKQSRCATLREGARLEGVTLTGGFVAGKWVSGAGALVEDGTISWCCISNNVAGVDRFDPAIDHVNNVYGAGVSIKQGSVDHTIFAYNEALASAGASHGGGLGVYCPTGDVLVDACLFYGNRAPQGHGGAIVGYFWNGINPYVLTVRNTTIVANEASATGGGIYITQNGVRSTYDFALVNSILADNVAGLGDPNLVFQEENNRAGYAAQSSYNLFANGTEALGEGSQSIAGSGAAWFVDPENEDYGIVLECPYEYADRAAKPTFDPGAGTEFVGSIEVTIACATAGATIYYTTDGSRPTASSAVYSGPITLTERTTIKARAYAEGVGPSAVSTALFSDGTIPLEPIELGEPVSRPGRDFNGSTVTVDFTGDIPEGTEPTAKITIEVPATAVTSGNTYEATITLVVGDDEYTKTTVLEQGRPVIAEESGWIHETASTFESTGAWSGEKAVVADGAIAVSNATFTAATAAPGDAVVTITSTFLFGEPSDDAFETSDRAAITVVPVDGVGRYAVATANGVETNLSVVAETASPVTVMVVMDCWANRVSYSVDGMALGTYPMAEKADGVSTMRYSGATAVTALDGTYLIERLDTNVAKAGDTEYPTVEEAVQSGKQPIELLWDASWDPTTPGVHTITTNGYDLEIGGDLDHAVTDNGDGTITVTVTDGTVHVRAKSITVGETTVLVGVDGIKAGRWYALEKTTDLSQGFVLDETTWTSATDLLVGTGELEIAIGENETCAFYQIRESDKDPNP